MENNSKTEQIFKILDEIDKNSNSNSRTALENIGFKISDDFWSSLKDGVQGKRFLHEKDEKVKISIEGYEFINQVRFGRSINRLDKNIDRFNIKSSFHSETISTLTVILILIAAHPFVKVLADKDPIDIIFVILFGIVGIYLLYILFKYKQKRKGLKY
ncbi:MAG: hypothetical protein ABIH25_03870 [Candidatus Woesearchaeota archaeon]